MRFRRLVLAAAAVVGVAAPGAAVMVPAQAATCNAPSVVGVEVFPRTVVVGVSKEVPVEIYLGVEANGCTLTKPLATVKSPTGGTGSWTMTKLDVVEGITTFGVVTGIPPQELYLKDAGRWAVTAQVRWSGGLVGDEATMSVVRAARLSINATPEPVTKGKTITVTGVLDRANWETGKYAGYTQQKVALQFKPAGGSYKTVKTITSASKGAVKTSVTATKDGCYRYTFAGTATTAKKTSTPDCIDVR